MSNAPAIAGIPVIHKVIISAIIMIALIGLLENAARIYRVPARDPFALYSQFGGDGIHGNFLLGHQKFIRDPELFWKMKPNLHIASRDLGIVKKISETTNSQGFRGSKEFGPKGKGIIRIISLGDSWTYGSWIEDNETYPEQLNRLLDMSPGSPRYEVFNLGCIGYSSYQGKVLAHKYLRALKPDLVIVCFGGNDTRRTKLFADKDQPVISGRVVSLQYLLSKSAFYNFMRNKIIARKSKMLYPSTGAGDIKDWPQRVSRDDYKKNIEDIVELSRRQGSNVMLMCYMSAGPFREAIEEISRDKGIPFVDLYRILNSDKNHSVGELSTDYPRDTHPNPLGYSLIAQALGDIIKGQL